MEKKTLYGNREIPIKSTNKVSGGSSKARDFKWSDKTPKEEVETPQEGPQSEEREPKRFDKGKKDFGPRKDFDRGPRKFDRDKKGFDRGPRKFDRDRKPFDRDRKPFGDRGPKKSFDKGPRDRRPQPIELPGFLNRVRNLHHEKGRDKEQAFLVEGVKCVEEILTHSADILDKIYYRDDFENEELFEKIFKLKAKAEAVGPREFRAISTIDSDQGILAVCRMASTKPDWSKARHVTLVDGVQDPGNLGSIIRSSLGFGLDGVVMGKGTADPYNPKVVRGSTGTFLRVPFENKVDLAERIRFLQSKGFTVVAMSSHAKQGMEIFSKKKKIAFLVGNEGAGADSKHMDLANEIVKIPMQGDLESLNVAVAHGIVAYELSKV